jgi:DNA-binding NarL/FixJ family response regulator
MELCSLVLRNPLHFRIVDCYPVFSDVVKKARLDKPHLVILDIDCVEDTDELFFQLQELKRKFPDIKMMILTNTLNIKVLTKAFQAGATGFILFEDGVKYLFDAVQEILAGGTPVSKKVTQLLVNSFQITHDSLLSRRERDVLREVATGKTYAYVADVLNISVDTVRSHVQHIFEKLNVNNKSEAVIKAREARLV